MRRISWGDEGFSLTELLIVLLVLGVLAAIVMLGVTTFRQDAVEACEQANQRAVVTAQAAYVAKNGPPAPDAETLLAEDYIQELPECG